MIPELHGLLPDLLDSQLDEERWRQLAELLRDNPAAQDEYRNFMAVHALLHLDFAAGQFDLLPPVVRPLPNATRAHDGSRPAELLTAWRRWRVAVSAVALAASILFVIWNLSPIQPSANRTNQADNSMTSSKQTPSPADGQQFSKSDVRAVAVLGQASRARWADSRVPTDIGASLSAGKFRLEKGLVQIEFFSGASVIIEAPAEFELISSSRIECDLGKIRAHVPSQAKGFTIGTPTFSAIDLGTEFTVQVESTGESHFQVLDGEVQLWDGRKSQSVLAQHLTAGQGMRSTPDGKLTEIDSAPASFVGRKQMLEMATAAKQERYQNWQQFSRTVRFDPEVILYYGFDGHAAWERVLRNEKPNGDETLDGAIVGCQWTTGRWNGKQALEFKRTSDRVRLNVPSEFDSLTLAAWLRIEGLERWLSSLLLTDGHQPGEVHWQMTDFGQLMLGVKAEPERSHDYYSPSVIGPLDLGRWVHLACVYNGEEKYVSHYLDGVEVSREKVRIQTKLRIGAAEIGNWVPQDLLDYRIRSLNGRVDEFIMFKRALSGEQVREIYEAGRPQ